MRNQSPTLLDLIRTRYLQVLLYSILFLMLAEQVRTLSMTVTSASPVVGISTNYTLTITNHSKPVTIRIQFSPWAPWQPQPYASNYQFYLNSGSFSNVLLTCRPRFGNALIECTSPTPNTQLGPTLQLRITNINNPSSTKPYPITIIFIYADASSQTVTSNLTVSTIPTSDVTLNGYNSTVGVVSSSVSWIVSFDYYFDYSTVLRIVYDSRLISLGFSSLTGVVATTSNSSNTITAKLTNWSDTASGLHLINYIPVTNPQAALTTTVTCTLEFTQSNITYSISRFIATFTIVPAVYTSMVGTTTLQSGLTGQSISINALTCPYTAVDQNSSSNVSYTDISYSISAIPVSTCTAPTINNSTKSCRYTTTAFPKTITALTQAITSNTISPITITTYTFYPPLSAYSALCSQIYNISLIPQQILLPSITYNTALCGTGSTGELNPSVRLVIKVDNAAVGDILTLVLPMGVMAGSWVRVPNTTSYKYVLTAADLVNTTHISLGAPYYNPTFTTASNYLTALTLSRIISNSTETVYARTSPTNLTIPICVVTTSSQLQSFSISLSTTATYSFTTTTFRYRNKFTDYSDTDYVRIQYKYYDNLLYLTTPEIAAGLTARLTTNGSTSTCTVTVVNNTMVNVYNISRLNMVGIINQMQLMGTVNPSAIYPVVSGVSGFQIVVTLMTAAGLEKEQATAQFSSLTNQTSYAYTTKTLTVSQSQTLPILKSGINFALTVTNTFKSRYYPSMPTTTLNIKLPFTCTQTSANRTILTSWQSFSATVTVNLTGCNIGYFNSSSFSIEASQYIVSGSNSLPSAYVMYAATLACGDNCLECSSAGYCTACVNSTFTYYLLYNGLCYSTCPQKTYHPTNLTTCQTCHPSCLTCNGSSLASCTSCQPNYYSKPINTSTQAGVTLYENICVSVCGEGKTLNTNTNLCQPCEIDCKFCIDPEYCYFCKTGASEVTNGKCDFLVCTDPCKSCEGSMTNCTTCVSEMYLYKFQCYSTCPANTYPNATAGQPNICMDITTPTLYFPVTICSIVLVVLVCICNTCIERGLTADSQRRNINMLSYSSSILALMELFALFIMVVSTFTIASRGLGIAGLLLWILCNVLFGIYYCKVIRKDEAVIAIVDKMTSQTKCIYYATIGFSIIVALRVYRVLYCGLFRGVAPYPVKKKVESLIKKRKGSEGRIANENTHLTIQQNQAPTAQPAQPQKEAKHRVPPNTNGKATSMSSKTVKNVSDIPAPPAPKAPPVQNNEVIEQEENTSQQSTQQHSKFQLKRPYIIYITISSLLASILFLAAGICEIIKNAYPAMLFWGLDLLIVVIASIIVTALDMWAGVKKSYLMALDKAPVNETMENLRADEDQATQQKMLSNAKVTQKMNKANSPTKKKGDEQKKPQKRKYSPPPNLIRKKSSSPKQKVLSPQQKQLKQKANKLKSLKSRYSDLYKRSKKPQQESSSNDQDDLPDIKVFEDVQMFVNDEVEPKKIKKVKADNKRMTSMQNMKKADNRSVLGQSSNATLNKNAKLNWKVTDIFLGFKDQVGSEADNKTVKLPGNDKGEREIYKVQRKKEDKSQESGEDPISYINSLQRKKNKKDKQQESEDKEESKFDFQIKSEQPDEQENKRKSPKNKIGDKEN